jgi:hypothetical protein
VEQARAAGARHIVWLGPASSAVHQNARAAQVGAFHEQNAEWQHELLPELGVTWVDSRPMTHHFHGRDGIHFTRTGYRTWAGGVLSDVTIAVEVERGDAEPDVPRVAHVQTDESEARSSI